MKGDTRLNFDTDLISRTCAPYNLPFHSSLMWKHYILVTNQIGTLASFCIKLQIVLLGIVNGQMFLCPHKKEKCTGVDYFCPKNYSPRKIFLLPCVSWCIYIFYWILKLNLNFLISKIDWFLWIHILAMTYDRNIPNIENEKWSYKDIFQYTRLCWEEDNVAKRNGSNPL